MSSLQLTECRSKCLNLAKHNTYNNRVMMSDSQQRPHHQRWLQSWKVFSIMMKTFLHWQFLGNGISITLGSRRALVGRFKGWDMQGYIRMWLTNACIEVFLIYCFIAHSDGVLMVEPQFYCCCSSSFTGI